MRNKKWIALLLVACTLVGTPHLSEIVFATSAEDKKNEAQNDLKDQNDKLNDLQNGQQGVKDEIKETQKQLSSLLTKQDALAKEIDTTNAAVVKTEKELEAAQKSAAAQYEAMKLRIQYMYENVQYAEMNTKLDFCMECGYEGEILCDENLEWYCPNCGNRDKDRMNVVRRTCGYLGENFWNEGRTQEIKERVLHL